MYKKISFVVLWCLVFSFSAFYAYREFNTNIFYGEANYIADFDDVNKVSGFAEDIFVAKIVENLGTYDNGEEWIYETLFQVETLYNIKWKNNKKINVVQMAWYDLQWNLHLPHWTEYLKEGNIYLLTTAWENPRRVLSHENWSHLLATMDEVNQKMTDSSSNSRKKIEKEVIKDSRVIKEFREAYKNEVYYDENEDWKYKISSEKNAYKNLWKKEKEDFENFESGFLE